MNRRLFQDLIIKNRPAESRDEHAYVPPVQPANGEGAKKVFWALVFIFLVVGSLKVSAYFANVDVKVTPRKAAFEVDDVFFVKKGDGTKDKLSYDLAKQEYMDRIAVNATQVKKAERKAHGTIVVYNEFSGNSQKLIAGTRFQTPEGKIYKISQSVLVPGFTLKDGKRAPGSLEADVFAERPGTAYNIDLSDFTLPAFKGTAYYEKIYARSKTKMEGGFSGDVRTASETDLAKAFKELERTIKEKAVSDFKSKIPPGYIMYEDGIFSEFQRNEELVSAATSSSAYVEGTLVLEGLLLSRDLLAKEIATKKVAGYDGSPVNVKGLESLTFLILGKDKVRINEDPQIGFNLKGNASLSWNFDESLLKKRLIGIRKNDYQAALVEFSSIERAEAVFRPFWATTFPRSEDRIKIEKISE